MLAQEDRARVEVEQVEGLLQYQVGDVGQVSGLARDSGHGIQGGKLAGGAPQPFLVALEALEDQRGKQEGAEGDDDQKQNSAGPDMQRLRKIDVPYIIEDGNGGSRHNDG